MTASKKQIKIGIAVVLLVVAAGIGAWRVLRAGSEGRADPEIEQKAAQMQAAIQAASESTPPPPPAPAPTNGAKAIKHAPPPK